MSCAAFISPLSRYIVLEEKNWGEKILPEGLWRLLEDGSSNMKQEETSKVLQRTKLSGESFSLLLMAGN